MPPYEVTAISMPPDSAMLLTKSVVVRLESVQSAELISEKGAFAPSLSSHAQGAGHGTITSWLSTES